MTDASTGSATDADLRRQPGHLIRRAQQVHTYLWSTEVSTEVTSTQFTVLAAIATAPGGDQNSLSRRVSLDTSTVADVVNRLHERGYVIRGRDPHDRRRNVLTLSEAGDYVYTEVSRASARMTERMLAPLRGAEREVLVLLLERLVEAGEALREA